ncbi:hypothetical protein V8G54_034095 [Vigna mungo]|uniref:non-specific serine/threonine protein kinase n=1 Tax=Vigna mungo TaxID=3915 RepID=A0AAQ3RJE7_VIGMU
MEHAKGGELFNKVLKGRLKVDAARKYFQQLISAVTATENQEPAPLNADGILEKCENDGPPFAESKHELTTPCNLNAFAIISFSTEFDLSGMFEDTVPMKEMWFMSNKPNL